MIDKYLASFAFFHYQCKYVRQLCCILLFSHLQRFAFNFCFTTFSLDLKLLSISQFQYLPFLIVTCQPGVFLNERKNLFAFLLFFAIFLLPYLGSFLFFFLLLPLLNQFRNNGFAYTN